MTTAKTKRPNLDEFVQSLCPTVQQENEPPYFRGNFAEGLDALTKLIPDGFVEETRWAKGNQRRIWTSQRDRSIITCCDNSLSVERFDHAELFKEQLDVCEDFYG